MKPMELSDTDGKVVDTSIWLCLICLFVCQTLNACLVVYVSEWCVHEWCVCVCR